MRPIPFVERRHVHQLHEDREGLKWINYQYIPMKLGQETVQVDNGKKYYVTEWECTQCPECFVEMTLIGEENAQVRHRREDGNTTGE